MPLELRPHIPRRFVLLHVVLKYNLWLFLVGGVLSIEMVLRDWKKAVSVIRACMLNMLVNHSST